MATLDEARKCSKCDHPGDLGGTQPHPEKPGFNIITISCRNPLCPWLDTGWMVQINPDGSVPDPAPPGQARGPKHWIDPLSGEAKMPPKGLSEDMVQKVNNSLANLQNRTQGSGEV